MNVVVYKVSVRKGKVIVYIVHVYIDTVLLNPYLNLQAQY